MRDIIRFSTLVLAVATLGAGAARAQPAASQGDAAAGRAAWQRAGCWACHGYSAQGADSTGPRLAGRPWTYDIFRQAIRHPSNIMPTFTEKVLSDREVADILAYVKSIPVRGR